MLRVLTENKAKTTKNNQQSQRMGRRRYPNKHRSTTQKSKNAQDNLKGASKNKGKLKLVGYQNIYKHDKNNINIEYVNKKKKHLTNITKSKRNTKDDMAYISMDANTTVIGEWNMGTVFQKAN